MRDENLTFGEFIRKKRLESSKELTLKKVAEELGMSLSLYNEIEKDRRKPTETFDYERLAELLDMDDGEKAMMYDLAAKKKRVVPSDIEDVMMYTPSGSYARMALRLTNEGAADEEDWKEFVRKIKKKRGDNE